MKNRIIFAVAFGAWATIVAFLYVQYSRSRNERQIETPDYPIVVMQGDWSNYVNRKFTNTMNWEIVKQPQVDWEAYEHRELVRSYTTILRDPVLRERTFAAQREAAMNLAREIEAQVTSNAWPTTTNELPPWVKRKQP